MKKISLFIVTMAIAATALVFSTAIAEELTVGITAAKGSAVVVRGESETAVQPGSKLGAGDVIKTSADGEVTLSWLGNVVKVYPLSKFRIEEAALNGKTAKSAVKLDAGRIFARAAKLSTPDSTFEIRTPTAIAGVRGSEIFITSAPEKSSFVVISGEFEVAADGISVVLDQSSKVAFGPGATEAESTPQEVSGEEMKELQTEADAVYEEANIETTSAPTVDEKTDVEEATGTMIEETTTNDTITSPATDIAIELEAGTGGVNLIID